MGVVLTEDESNSSGKQTTALESPDISLYPHVSVFAGAEGTDVCVHL